jgi:hypothetical protein
VKKIIRGEKDEVRAQCFEWGWVYIIFHPPTPFDEKMGLDSPISLWRKILQQ